MASSLLAKSAQGATFLILLQVGSRALTFIVNQILLRYLSPQILGVATQLELFSISTLYFARESIRVALQRQRSEKVEEKAVDGTKGKTPAANSYGDSRNIQESVNLSYAAIAIGLLLTAVFGQLYVRNADNAVLETPYIHYSLNLYILATIFELLSEPYFAIAQQQMLYGTRASAEMQATFTRCVVTCSTAVFASRSGLDLGVFPFALGQLTYALVLATSYLLKIYPVCKQNGATLLPRIPSNSESYLPRPILKLAATLYGQSLFKQLLTSGDQYLIATLTPLPSQGAYALASNYGSLLARLLFQPLEESSRSLFARLLPASPAPSSPPHSLPQASTYLHSLLHAYTLLSLLTTTLFPPLAPLLLSLLAGPRWSSTEAPLVLAAYAYYIPLLAINGILEAYVSAVATPAQLRAQSIWMVGFSLAFAATGVVVLGWWGAGARGLVVVNAVVMVLRIGWSWRFVQGDLRGRGGGLGVWGLVPEGGSVAVGVGARCLLERVDLGGGGSGLGVLGLVKVGGVVGGCGVGM